MQRSPQPLPPDVLSFQSHSGERLAEAFMQVLRDFGIEDKVGYIQTLTSNDVLTWL